MTVLELTMNRARAGKVDVVDVGFASRARGAVDRSGEVEMDQIALDKARSSITPTAAQELHRLIGTFYRLRLERETRRVLFEEPIEPGGSSFASRAICRYAIACRQRANSGLLLAKSAGVAGGYQAENDHVCPTARLIVVDEKPQGRTGPEIVPPLRLND
jgi:hypothetical protein